MSKELSDRYTQLLQEHHIVQTYVDARHCMGLPTYLSGGHRLDIGLNMVIPVNPLQVNELGLTVGLSFRGVKHTVYIPWHAIRACFVEDNNHTELLRGFPISTPEKVGEFPKQFAGRVHDMLNQEQKTDSNNQKVIRVDFANRKKM